MPWVTDGAFSPDGTRLTLRGYFTARTYPWKDGLPVGEGERVDAPWQGQAESVTYTPDGSTLMFGAEGEGSRVIAVPVAAAASASPQPGAPSEAAPTADPTGSFGKGALVLAGGLVLVLGAKRLLRRRS